MDDISSTFNWRLSSLDSIVTAELFAIFQGIVFAKKHLKDQNTAIFSDSLSALLMMKHYNDKNSQNVLVKLIVQLIYNINVFHRIVL